MLITFFDNNKKEVDLIKDELVKVQSVGLQG